MTVRRETEMNFKTQEELNAMTKADLDAYGESIGIKLDRRKKKATMLEELTAYQDAEKARLTTEAEEFAQSVVDSIEKIDTNTDNNWASWFILGGAMFLVGLALAITYILNN